jgi:hypothetical protein
MTYSIAIHFPRFQHQGTLGGNFVELARHGDEGHCLSWMSQLQWKLKMLKSMISKKILLRTQVLKLDYIIST